jgi:hypothetical protein
MAADAENNAGRRCGEDYAPPAPPRSKTTPFSITPRCGG